MQLFWMISLAKIIRNTCSCILAYPIINIETTGHPFMTSTRKSGFWPPLSTRDYKAEHLIWSTSTPTGIPCIEPSMWQLRIFYGLTWNGQKDNLHLQKRSDLLMLCCYMAICIASCTGGYSEALSGWQEGEKKISSIDLLYIMITKPY